MISEPDAAKLKFLGGENAPMCDGLEHLSPTEIVAKVGLQHSRTSRCVFVVRPTGERDRHWWIHAVRSYFRDSLSVLTLDDGREAICTWGAR